MKKVTCPSLYQRVQPLNWPYRRVQSPNKITLRNTSQNTLLSVILSESVRIVAHVAEHAVTYTTMRMALVKMTKVACA